MRNRPATFKQIDYAKDISNMLGIPLPAENDISTYANYIASNLSKFYSAKERAINIAKYPEYEKQIPDDIVPEVEARLRLELIRHHKTEEALTTPEAVTRFLQRYSKHWCLSPLRKNIRLILL